MNQKKLFISILGVATLLIGCSKPDSNIATENAAKTAIADDAKEKMDAAREKLKEALDAWVSGTSNKQYEKDHYNVNFADSEYKGGKVLMRYEIGELRITRKVMKYLSRKWSGAKRELRSRRVSNIQSLQLPHHLIYGILLNFRKNRDCEPREKYGVSKSGDRITACYVKRLR